MSGDGGVSWPSHITEEGAAVTLVEVPPDMRWLCLNECIPFGNLAWNRLGILRVPAA
jgi:hypothetical protein